ncbi:tc3a_0 protein [Trichonephila clavipes]|nr:tc3a_0 protein [Trichonephila clavipes]
MNRLTPEQRFQIVVEWAQNEIAVVPDFHKRILFSDEAHFWLNGYVNKQNCRIWSEANPEVYVETPLHPEKLTVWCALWAGAFFIPELNNHDVQELWFQQDVIAATCHTARATIDLLKDTFGDRLISRFGPVNCPPRSCDLIPLDYFLWWHLQGVYFWASGLLNSPQSHNVRVYDVGHGKSGVYHSAEWHDGDWLGDGIREAWLWFFIWVESF